MLSVRDATGFACDVTQSEGHVMLSEKVRWDLRGSDLVEGRVSGGRLDGETARVQNRPAHGRDGRGVIVMSQTRRTAGCVSSSCRGCSG
eukprot:1304958-Rhodomonas_salina.1